MGDNCYIGGIMRYLIKFSYDGTNFYGYQKQPGFRTVEEELEKALYNINNKTITRVFASGRTDKGVHALGQCAHFDLDINITLYKLKCALNSLLPNDIHVFSTEIVDKDFHARFNVKEKTYIYKINIREYDPVSRNYIYQYNKDLNIDKMNIAIRYYLGEHDFKAFVSEEAVKSSYIRNITAVEVKEENNIVVFSFSGNGFMKYQVRNMVGLLIKIGQNKFEPNIIEEIFDDYDKRKYITTAKSEGLYLKNVIY